MTRIVDFELAGKLYKEYKNTVLHMELLLRQSGKVTLTELNEVYCQLIEKFELLTKQEQIRVNKFSTPEAFQKRILEQKKLK